GRSDGRACTRGARRALQALRARADGRRVPVGADLLRPAAEGRRARAGREPDVGLPPHGRRPRRGEADRPDRVVAGRAAAGAGALRTARTPDGARAVKLVDAARCPYCARVRITLAEKRLDVETVEVD